MHINPPVSSDELPAFERQETNSLAKIYPLSRVVTALGYLVCFAVLYVLTRVLRPEANLPLQAIHLLWALPVIVLLVYFVWLSASKKAYAVRRDDISYYSGVIFRRVVVQPITRLQHIEINRGMVERAFGLATLTLYSAGGAGHSIAIPGLPLHTAESLRELITTSGSLSDA